MAEREAGHEPAAAASAASAGDERNDGHNDGRNDGREAERAAELVDRSSSEAAELMAMPPSPSPELRPGDDDLPVVARLIVEIRSDGSRTIARGALEDANLGQRVAVEARGDSPLALALALAKSIGSMTASLAGKKDGADRPRLPRLSARAALRGLLDRRKK